MKIVSVLSVVTALSLLGACGSESGSSSKPEKGSEANATFNDADSMFAQMMIPHHEQAIEMSDIALDPAIGASSAVLELAAQIKSAQDPEIAQMTLLLKSWGESVNPDMSMDHSSMMGGMMSYDELQALGDLNGKAFDIAWAKAMIMHHEGAIDMAEVVLADGTNAEIQTLAKAIVEGQTAEIETLQSIAGK